MAGLSKVFETARRSLFAQRDAMDVTSHNIANAGTTGFTRQRAELTTTTPLPDRVGLLGTGVEMSSVSRLREKFIDTQYRNTNQSLNNASMQSRIFSQIEGLLNEPSDNALQNMMQGFYKAWQTLASTPEDTGARQVVLQSARTLSNGINQLYTGFTQLQNDLKEEAVAKVDTVNALARDIASFNEKIMTAKNGNLSANDLMDSRDLKIDELSKLVNMRVSEDNQGALNVSVGGVSIVNQTDTISLELKDNGTTISINATGSSNSSQIINGELGGILKQYNTVLPAYKGSIDTMSQSIMDGVNAVHQTGYGLKTQATDPTAPTGTLFFTSYGNGVLTVNPDIVDNLNLIAASTDGSAGNNKTAIQIANLFDTPTMSGGTISVHQYYNAFASRIGTESADAARDEQSQTLILTQVEGQRNSFSGVSLDEEMTNMIKFQRAYDASAKLIKTVDDMMNSIIALR
ncbi:MAG TPA: flagellar hook-associated protein FlgK [Bacteroidota bacterium]|nr:flagellar hook-associated protein FlgK [Bacteroidota bacterium]